MVNRGTYQNVENYILSHFSSDKACTDEITSDIINSERVKQYLNLHKSRFELITNIVSIYNIPISAKILDIGTSYGVVPLYLKSMRYTVAATELQERDEFFSTHLKSKGIDIKAWDINTEPPPFSSNTFDVIIAAEVLEHLQVSLYHSI